MTPLQIAICAICLFTYFAVSLLVIRKFKRDIKKTDDFFGPGSVFESLEGEYSSKPFKIPNAIYMKLGPEETGLKSEQTFKVPLIDELPPGKIFIIDDHGDVVNKIRKGNWYV